MRLTSNDPVKQFLGFDGKPQPIKKEEEDLYFSSSFFCPNCGQPIPSLNCYCSYCGKYIGEQYDSNSPQTNVTVKEIIAEEKHKSNQIKIFGGLIALVIIVFVILRMVGGFDSHELQMEKQVIRKSTKSENMDNPYSNFFPLSARTKTIDSIDYLFAPEAEMNVDRSTSTSRPKNKIPSLTMTQATKIKTITPTTCPGAPRQRLEVGEDAVICTRSDNVFLRTGAGKRFSIIRAVSTGTVLKVTGGPRCSDNWSFWAVELPDGTSGWMSEGGDEIDPYFLCPN